MGSVPLLILVVFVGSVMKWSRVYTKSHVELRRSWHFLARCESYFSSLRSFNPNDNWNAMLLYGLTLTLSISLSSSIVCIYVVYWMELVWLMAVGSTDWGRKLLFLCSLRMQDNCFCSAIAVFTPLEILSFHLLPSTSLSLFYASPSCAWKFSSPVASGAATHSTPSHPHSLFPPSTLLSYFSAKNINQWVTTLIREPIPLIFNSFLPPSESWIARSCFSLFSRSSVSL